MAWWIAVFHAVALSIAATRSEPPAELHTYVVDRDASVLYVVVHRAGLLSFLGHEHAVVPGGWSAEICLADPVPQGAHASLVVETASLVIDSDSARALAGMGGGPGDDDRRDIQTRMLGAQNLDAADFPEIRLELRAAEPGRDQEVTVEGTISVRGVTRDVRLPVVVGHGDSGRLVLRGMLRIRLRDFGIEPESRAGVVKVSNDVDLHFALAVLPTEEACGAA